MTVRSSRLGSTIELSHDRPYLGGESFPLTPQRQRPLHLEKRFVILS